MFEFAQQWWQTLTKNKAGNRQFNFTVHQQEFGRAQALAFYEGHAPRQLKTKPEQPDDNIFVNYPQLIVDKGVAFLFGDGLKIECGADGAQNADEYLEKVWNQAQRDVDLVELATDGAIFGSAWLKIVLENGKPRVIVPDPRFISIETDPHDYRRVLEYRCQYTRGSSLYKEEIKPQEQSGWTICEYTSADTGKTWTKLTETAWDFAFPPYFHARNLPNPKQFDGKPDLTKSVLDLCRHLSRLDSLISRIVRCHAAPKPYAKGLMKQDLHIGTDEVLFLGLSEKAELGLLEMTGDLGGAIAVRKQFRESLAEISNVPEIATGKLDSIGALSGKALRILYQPLIEQTNLKRRLYGKTIADCAKALLTIGGFENERVTLHWADPIPTDPKEEAETALLWKQIGVSDDTLQRRNGFDPEQEREKFEATR
jgi:hypothetical protein